MKLVLLVAALAWGASMTTADAALEELTPADMLLTEVGTGTLLVALVCLATGRRLSGSWRPAVTLGALQPGLAYVLADVGLAMSSAAVGSVLLAMESVFVVLIAGAVLRVRPSGGETVALAAGVGGVVLVASAQGGGQDRPLGAALLVLAAAVSAVYTFRSGRLGLRHEPFALVVRQGVAALVLTSPFVAISWATGGSHLLEASPRTLALAALTGLIGFAAPFMLWTLAAPRVGSGFAAVSLTVVPLAGVVTAALAGRAELSPVQWLGAATILGGVILLTVRELRPRRRTASVPAQSRSGDAGFLPGHTSPRVADSAVRHG